LGSFQNYSNLSRCQTGTFEHGTNVGALYQMGIQWTTYKTGAGHFLLQSGQLGRRRAGVRHGHLGTTTGAPTRHRQAGDAKAQDEYVLVL
jgi:hypothetical protein